MTEQGPSAVGEGSTPPRQAWALGGAAVVVAVVVGIVLAFGIVDYPDLPTLTEQPDPPVGAQMATMDFDRRQGPCVRIIDGRGVQREVGCGRDVEGELVWLDDGRLGLRTYRGPVGTVEVVDVETQEVVDTVDEADDRFRPDLVRDNDDGDRVSTGVDDGMAYVRVRTADGDERRVLSIETPASYQFYDAGWSADGRWILVLDSIGRAIVVDGDGEGGGRIWAEDVGIAIIR